MCFESQLRGVILNKVEPDKFDMVKDYYGRVLADLWETPLLGVCTQQHTIHTHTHTHTRRMQSLFMAVGCVVQEKTCIVWAEVPCCGFELES